MSNNRVKNPIKIMVFGTFDGLHLGHLHFLKQAKSLSKRGSPFFGEKKRKKFIEKSKIADKVVLGGVKNHLPHILSAAPDIIALGYDQKAYVKGLKKDLKEKKLSVKIVRLKPYKEKIYKSSLLNHP